MRTDSHRLRFLVMRMYEAETWPDLSGHIAFTNSRGLTGVGLPRKTTKGDTGPCWEDVKDWTGPDALGPRVELIVHDDTLPGGTIVYRAPWVRCDQEKDYETAWRGEMRPVMQADANFEQLLDGKLRKAVTKGELTWK